MAFRHLIGAVASNALYAPPARLPRNVPEKPEGFPLGMPPDHHELQSHVARHHAFSRSTRKSLGFFRPITRRMNTLGAQRCRYFHSVYRLVKLGERLKSYEAINSTRRPCTLLVNLTKQRETKTGDEASLPSQRLPSRHHCVGV
jgi:hypothetical protein